jgi:hypothetical protein
MVITARQASRLLLRVKELRVRESTFADAKRLADDYKGHADCFDGPCSPEKCSFRVIVAFGWAGLPYTQREILRAVGVREFAAFAFVQTRTGAVVSANYSIWAEARRRVPEGQWLNVSASLQDRFPEADFYYGRQLGLEDHPIAATN